MNLLLPFDEPGGMTLRDYQEEIVRKNLDAMERGTKSVLNGLFTGAGKTVCFVELANRILGRTLIICPMRELVWQACEKVRAITGREAAIEMADFRADEVWPSKIIVASKQTLLSRSGGEQRYRRFDGFQLVIVDEAHLMMSESVQQMLKFFQDQGAMVSGFTATPFRMDGRPMIATTTGAGQC